MFGKHLLRDVMLLLLIGITLTFTFNIQAVNTGDYKKPTPSQTALPSHH